VNNENGFLQRLPLKSCESALWKERQNIANRSIAAVDDPVRSRAASVLDLKFACSMGRAPSELQIQDAN
jgi:hypothetical protein